MTSGKPGFPAMAACGAHVLGAISLLAGIVTRVAHVYPLGIGPKSYAVGAALFFLCSIAISGCPCCGARCCEKSQAPD